MIELLVIFSFVSYRIARFLIEDDLISGTRARFTVWLQSKNGLVASKILDLTECPYCVTVWTSLGVVGVSDLVGVPVPHPGLLWLATCGGSMMVWAAIEWWSRND